MEAVTLDRRALLVYNRLRPMYLFKSLADGELAELTRLFERTTPDPASPICIEGETGEWFYVVDKGRVRLTWSEGRREVTLEPGDFFGAEALLEGGLHPYTANAVGRDVSLLRLSGEELKKLVEQQPYVREGLRLMAETRRWLQSRPWEWIAPNESVALIIRRHDWVLWQRQLLPGAVLLFILLGVALAWYLGVGFLIGPLLFLAALAAAWMWLVYVDWGNDFYVVTNQRVVYVEKVVLLYDSRLILRMGELTSVGAEAASLADRLLEYGDVSVYTLAKPMTLKAIAYPQIVAALIEEQIGRAKQRARQSEVEILRAAIRDRIQPPVAEPKPERLEVRGGRERRSTPLGRQLQQFFSLQLRYEEGDTIIYRKHWWRLLTHVFWPSVVLVGVAAVVVFSIIGQPRLPEPLTLEVTLLVGAVLFIFCIGWWLYEFQDWRNDLYQVTLDQIVDVYRRPLGQETRDSALLSNIQSLRSERTGLLGRLLNFGNVIATIPGKEFTFDDVYDPLNVQEDIQRRIEAFKARQARREALRRREELTDVLSAYYLAVQDLQQNQARQ
ncbi:MAG: cyclic nucleotide-binding domain-containing protein [Anaerolineales bacterium]|nr:cyclic nucleotide-binding domain-containing protein [Anaerolineales bacterium]